MTLYYYTNVMCRTELLHNITILLKKIPIASPI